MTSCLLPRGALWCFLSIVSVGAVASGGSCAASNKGACQESEVTNAAAKGTAQMQLRSSFAEDDMNRTAMFALQSSVLQELQDSCPCALVFIQGTRAQVGTSPPVKPPSCEPFCQDNGCPCLLPWVERCNLNSCADCQECGGSTTSWVNPSSTTQPSQSTTQPTTQLTTQQPTQPPTACSSGAWGYGECVNVPSNTAEMSGVSSQSGCTSACLARKTSGCCYWKGNGNKCKWFPGVSAPGNPAGGGSRRQSFISCR
mmetsp:Transcript_35457/g.80140  ORF Transcript_35457/g.80140 Transcript_35457/m.80140 type:complete len:256 (-) Transcript_35457:115-882(-)